MENKKTLLTKQKRIIIIIACLALVIAAACIAFPYIFKEQLNTIYARSESGDAVECTIYDKTTGKSIKGDIEKMRLGEIRNKYFVKDGESEDILYTFHKNDVVISYQPYIIPEIPKNKVKKITVTNETGTFSVFGDGKENFFVEGAESNLYNQQLLSELVFQARFMLADRYVENPTTPEDYGLTEELCRAMVTIETMDGKVHTVFVGDSVEGSGQYYMKHIDKPSVYLMDNTVSIFFEDVRIYLNPVVVSPIEEQARNYIENFVYARDGEPFFACEIIPDEERVGVYANQLHKMVYPEEEFVLNTTTLYEMFSLVGSLSGAGVVEYGVFASENPEELLSKYGLIDPYAHIAFTYGGANYTIIIGNAEEYNGELYYYVYSEYQDTIVMVAASSLTFLDYEMIDLFQENVFQYNINEVTSIEVKTPSVTRNYLLSGEGDSLSITESTTGKTIDTPSFRQFYISLLGVRIAGYSKVEGSGAEKLDHNLSYVVTLKSGDVLNFDFYSESTMNCYMVVNGKSGFKTDRKQINKIIQYSDMLINGEKIESLLG